MSAPSPAVAAFLAAWSCFDCASGPAHARPERDGVWTVVLEHDPDCPTLSGAVSYASADAAAVAAALAAVAGGES